MKRETFIENFTTIVGQRLERLLPKEAPEGYMLFVAYDLTARCLKHIVKRKLGTEKG